jgi:glyoxalase family protein
MQLTGIHHLTAISTRPRENLAFYTGLLGMRLVKKTVNQDNVSAYHLFYADGKANPGTDLTFFDFPLAAEQRGTNSISRTGLRVAGEKTLGFWRDRLRQAGNATSEVIEVDGRLTLPFEDGEGQRLVLVDDGGAGEASPWERSPVPPEHQIRGLGPIVLTVSELSRTAFVLTEVMNMRRVRDYAAHGAHIHVFAMGEGGLAAELHVLEDKASPPARQGAGGVHHVAFRTPDEAQYHGWTQRLNELRVPNSGEIDRFYFRSLYFREPNGILFEIATDRVDRHCERSEAIHRGACGEMDCFVASAPRNDGSYSFAFSRRVAPEVCWISFALDRKEGAGNAGCALHPRSHAQCAQKVRA